MAVEVHSLVNLIETDSQNGNDVISFWESNATKVFSCVSGYSGFLLRMMINAWKMANVVIWSEIKDALCVQCLQLCW